MTGITLDRLRHSYLVDPKDAADYALKRLDMEFEDGGAYALLGPSGCGKTTLLNIISGLVTPSDGKVLFDGEDVSHMPTDQRQIAQVFQFPVVYDTMTVYQNLAFPLRNRGIAPADIDRRVREIADMIDLTDTLDRRASGLSADGKQKISLGRGLVRSDVNVIMFDEPLTVIDPHLKWQLRSKLKELHQRVGTTMIYVTHDQTEALTFADKVVVMNHGEVVQIGTPVELFEAPRHTFVGHFIGSPGMNLLPCEVRDGGVRCFGVAVETANAVGTGMPSGELTIGVRPEFVSFADRGLPVTVIKVADAGRYRVVDTVIADHTVKLLLAEGQDVPTGTAHIAFRPSNTRVYADGRVLDAGGRP